MNRAVAPDYIRGNFQPSDRLAVMLIQKSSGELMQRIASADQIASEPFQAWLRFKNKERHEVYVSMNTLRPGATGRKKSDIAEIRHVYLDFDKNGKESLEALAGRPDVPEPNHVLESSPGKYQVVWRVEQFEAHQAEALMRGMVREFGADPAATDSTRVLRVPGTYNHKYEVPHYVTVQDNGDHVCRPDQFPDFRADRQPAAERELQPRQGSTISGAELTQSERDWAFAKRALSRGDAPEVIVAQIAAYRPDKQDPNYYATRTVQRAIDAMKASQNIEAPTGSGRW